MSERDAVDDSSLSETSASSPTASPPAEERLLTSVTAPDPHLTSKKGKRRRFPLWSRESIEAAAYDRDRMTYEHMLVRYGSWRNVRGQVLAYTLLTAIAFVYKAHVDFIELTASIETVDEGRHVHCCCEIPARICYLADVAELFHSGGFLEYGKYLLALLFGFTCPLWERYVGRRAGLLVTVLTGMLCSFVLMFSHPTESLQAIHIIMTLCVASVMLISMANLTEMLPYNLRFIAVSCYVLAHGLTLAIASLHFYSGFSFRKLAILSGFGYLAGVWIVIYYARDSICHLNIRNEADTVEEMIHVEEERLLDQNPAGSVHFHSRAARKIFEDLVYLDRDELKLINFLKRLLRNSVMLEIVIALFQSFSAGLHEYEFGRFWSEQFRGPYLVGVDRIAGYFVASVTILLLRRVHRVKALTYVFSANLLINAFRHAIVAFDKHNGCANIDLIEAKYNLFSSILGVLSISFGSCLQILILLHFLETTPSILRLTAPMLVYLPMKLGVYLGEHVLKQRTNNLHIIGPVYAYHMLIIVVTLARARSKLPYSLYLFDLMPVSEKEPESEREDSSDEELFVPATNNTSMVVCDQKKQDKFDESSKGFDPIARLEKMMKSE